VRRGALAVAVLLAGCGRIGFDLLDGGGATADGPMGSSDAGATMVPSNLQSITISQDQGNNITAQFFGNVTQGDLLVAAFTFAPVGAVTKVEDTVSSHFTVLAPVDNSAGQRVELAYAAAALTGHDEVTVFIADEATDFELVALEYAGIAASSPLQAMASAQATDGSGSVELATTASNELALGYAVTPDGNTTVGAGMIGRSFTANDIVEDAVVAVPGEFEVNATTTGTMTLYAVAFRAAGL
jgi:hypothetical protein